MTTTTRPRGARMLAHAAMALLLLTTVVTPALAAGGDHGACGDGSWMKADWSGNSWIWEAGPAWDGDAPPPPTLDATLDEDGEPQSAAWTSTVTVGSVHVKAGQGAASFPGGTAGTVTGVGKHAISHVVFCYPPQPPPPPPVEVGSLTVTKTVTGEAPADATFAFTAQGLDRTDTFALAADGSRTYTDLPAGTEVTITETDAAGADHTTVDGTPGTSTTIQIVADTTVTVAFVNTYDAPPPPPVEVGSLTVTKTVTGEAPADATFAFTAQGLDRTDTFALAADGSRTYTDLPAGTEVTITETDAAGADHTTVDGTPGTSTTIQIVADTTVTVAFVNTYDAPVETDPDISLVKEALIEPGADGLKGVTYDPAGVPPVITYRYTITNDGETPLVDVSLDDDVIGPIDLPVTALDVDEELVIEADHAVTPTEAAAGTVRNTAVVVAEAPDGREVTDTAVETVVVTTVLPRTEEPKTPPAAPEGPTDPAPSVKPETEVRGVTQRVAPRAGTEVRGAVLARTGQPVAGMLALAALALLLGGALTRTAGPAPGRR